MEQVTQVNISNGVKISFELEGNTFDLHMIDRKIGYQPLCIAHQKESSCSLCGDKYWVCEELTPRIDELFLQAIEHPSIRLFWVTHHYMLRGE